jgi:hypothetical protein
MKLNRLIMKMLDWPSTMGDRLRDWLEEGHEIQKQSPHPLSRRCYLTSEAHMSGYRLIIGFENLEDLDAAHYFLARELKPNTEAQGRR